MLKELFEATFYLSFPPKKHVKIALEEQIYVSDFSLVDPKACRACRCQCSDNEAGRKQLLVRTESPVNVISLDNVLSYIEEPVGPICDYMLDDVYSPDNVSKFDYGFLLKEIRFPYSLVW